MAAQPVLHLEYGVNAFADRVYRNYLPLQSTAHYPDPLCSELRQALAKYTGLPEAMILVASGSDELIDIYIRMQKERVPGLKVAFSPPTYPQYDAYTARERVECLRLPHERAAITAKLVQSLGGDPVHTVVMLDSPANPSGETIRRKQFLGLLHAGYQVFVDEAYYEFHGETMADCIAKYPRQLVVSRSLSKFAAMAGNRIGYLLASPELIAEFRVRQLFFNVNSEGQHRALHALAHADKLHTAIAQMRQTKQKVESAIHALGAYDVFPALDMYAIFKHHRIPTEELHRRLLENHAIKTSRFPSFKDHDVIRTAILQPKFMRRLTTALGEYV